MTDDRLVTITIDDVRRAAQALAGSIIQTPFQHSRTLSRITGAEVFLKFENHQFTASFKERGALNTLLSLDEPRRQAGVIAASAGNHAQAVAYHAQRLGIVATIVMPRFTPTVKVAHTRGYGAEVILHGDVFDDARQHALELAVERGLTWIHPYDDARVIAGQGTLALEMLAAEPGLDTLVVPVGGGGIIAGMAIAAKAVKPSIDIVGVQTDRFPSMYHAVHGGDAVFGSSSIADGIAVKQPGSLTAPIVRELVSEVLLVDEANIEQAILLLLEVEKTVVEGAGGTGLAALLRHPARFTGRRVGLVLCGGNIDPLTLSGIVERGMVRTWRLTRVTVELRDRPGALAQVTACLADLQTNIVEILHHRVFSNLPVQAVAVELTLETRGPEHVREVVARLSELGFKVDVRLD